MCRLIPGTLYQFGPFEVNLTLGELLKNGRPIRLQDQPYRLLLVLLEIPGEVSAARNFETGCGAKIRLSILTAA